MIETPATYAIFSFFFFGWNNQTWFGREDDDNDDDNVWHESWLWFDSIIGVWEIFAVFFGSSVDLMFDYIAVFYPLFLFISKL